MNSKGNSEERWCTATTRQSNEQRMRAAYSTATRTHLITEGPTRSSDTRVSVRVLGALSANACVFPSLSLIPSLMSGATPIRTACNHQTES